MGPLGRFISYEGQVKRVKCADRNAAVKIDPVETLRLKKDSTRVF
jgi:hypothetical protein